MKKVNFEELNFNAYTKIAKEWMLVTAGNSKENYNTMTASWGQLGSLWGHGGGKQVATCYVRPQRYTKKFVDNNEYFSLSFFSEEYKKDLGYLGTVSGKDEDKVSKTKLTPIFDDKAAYFAQADMVLICKKLYAQELKEECFTDIETLNDAYPLRDFHTMYVGEIVCVYVKE